MKIIKTMYDAEIGTTFYNIEGIDNWDLRDLYNLLLAEEARASLVSGWFRGSKDLFKCLEKHFQGLSETTKADPTIPNEGAHRVILPNKEMREKYGE